MQTQGKAQPKEEKVPVEEGTKALLDKAAKTAGEDSAPADAKE